MLTDSHPDAAPPHGSSSGVHTAVKKTPAPVLASDALREDLAPLEPGRKASRLWDGALAAGFLVVGVCLKLKLGVTGVSPDAGSVCLAAGAAIGATALLPFPYLWRALVAATVGVIVAIMGLNGGGPLALMAMRGVSSWLAEGCRVLAATAIPAALLFRSHYRAYRRGRRLLLVALLVATPFLIHEALIVVANGDLLGRIGAAIALSAVLSTLCGFLGAPPTAAAAWWAGLVTGAIAFDLGLRQFYAASAADWGAVAHILTGVAFIVGVSPIALGLFQVLAAVYARDARNVDVHHATDA